jgi:hypothetical protein
MQLMTSPAGVPDRIKLIGPVIAAIPVHLPRDQQDPTEWVVMCFREETGDFSTHRVYRRGDEVLAENGNYDLHYAMAYRDLLERAGLKDPNDPCEGECVSRPHRWSPSGARCTRTGCNVAGTGDRCNDGNCEGED